MCLPFFPNRYNTTTVTNNSATPNIPPYCSDKPKIILRSPVLNTICLLIPYITRHTTTLCAMKSQLDRHRLTITKNSVAILGIVCVLMSPMAYLARNVRLKMIISVSYKLTHSFFAHTPSMYLYDHSSNL